MSPQIYMRKIDGSYNRIICSNCNLEINETDYMGLQSVWMIDQCFDCGRIVIFCSKNCRKKYFVKHKDVCPPNG